MGGNNKVMSIVIPMAIGAATGGLGAPAAVAGKAATFAPGLVGGTASTLFGSQVAAGTMSVATASALAGAGIGLVGGVAMQAMTPDLPDQPDFSQQFGEQQAMLTNQQSFGRKPTGELEQMLEFGSDWEKNQAYDELQRRGEDEQRLTDIQTRRDRTDERQAEIDDYIDRNAPPTEGELDILRATLIQEEEDKLDADIEAERTRAKQVMARKGMGSSNAMSQLNARLEDVRYKGNLAIRNDVNNRVVDYARGVSSLQDQGLQRLMSASSMDEATSRFDIGMQDAERKLQEGLRQSRTAQQNSLALNKFRTEVTGLNNAYEQEINRQNTTAMLGLGALGIAAPRIWPTAEDKETPASPGGSNPYQWAGTVDARTQPDSTSQGLVVNDPFAPRATQSIL